MNGKFSDNFTPTTPKKWWEEFPKAPEPQKHQKPEVEVIGLKNEAKRHLEAETAAYQLKRSKVKDSEYEWLKTAAMRGTLKDKVAASIILIQENPKYNLQKIISLVGQVKGMFKVIKQAEQERTAKKQSLITDVRDLFLEELLHPGYKLLKFEDQNLDEIPSANDFEAPKNDKSVPRSRLLAHWYFEDQLKDQYEKFLTSLSSVAAENIEANREKAVGIMTDLLIANAEQEQRILDFLVNKIGDPKAKVASKAVYCLNQVLLQHPNMKLVVLQEVEKLLFRPNLAQRAQYYAICLLTQYVLDKSDAQVATTLIDVYFAFFKACLKKGEPDSRMMAAILTGVNRAYRFASLDGTKINEHIDAVYKVIHVGSFNVALNALGLLHQVASKDPKLENRFYTAFYRKLLDPEIGTAAKRAVFLNLLYRVMKSDRNTSRVYAFVKRVVQVAAYFPACMTCATLYAISQLYRVRKDLRQMVLTGPVVVKTEKDVDEEVNGEENENSSGNDKQKADSKKSKKNKKNKNKQVEEEKQEEDDDDIQHLENTLVLSNVITKPLNSTSAEEGEEKKDIAAIEVDRNPFYDPFERNPLRSGAVKSPLAELISHYRHFHPTVTLFATKVIEGSVIEYTGDPLEDLTLIRFLDRYVFKNPKKLEEKKVTKVNDPLATRAQYIPRGLKSLPVDSQAYLNEREERIPVDELFLYKYLKQKQESIGIKKEDDDDDNDSVNSEEFNEMLDELAGNKDFDELDIAGDLGSQMKKGKLKDIQDDEEDSEGGEEDDEEDEDDGLYDDDGESMDEDNLEEDIDGSDIDLDDLDDDGSDLDFNDSEDEEDGPPKKSKSSNPLQKSLKKKGADQNVFMSAEAFAEMLEEQGRSKQKHGGANALSDADGAHVKQLDWEANRHQKIRGKFGGNKRKFDKGGFKNGKNKKFKRKN
uniref:CCAAT-binding factor domain-containing protein n=1 Tax=Bracon brevicornis TaxID=1563983 RepID=A0A6V7JQB2_9HYME